MRVKSKKFKILLGIGLLAVVLAVSGWLFFRLHLSWLSIDDGLGVVLNYHEGDATFTFDNNGIFDVVFHTKEPVVYFGNERIVMRDGIRVRNGRPYINRRDLWVFAPDALDHIIEADTSAPVAVIVNGLYGRGTSEQNEMIHSLLGGELARDRFELYFQWYNTIHELGHMITHSNGTSQLRHMVEEEMLANSFAIAFWTYFGEEEKLYALEETVEYILSNITPPAENVHHLDFMREAVDAGRFAEVFEFETYGWFQFSIVRDILCNRDSLDLAQLLTEMTGSENIQAQPRQRLTYPNLGTDIVPIIVGDAISVLEEWGVENLPDVYIAFSADPNAHMYQYPMPRSLLEPNIEAGRVLRIARSLHNNVDFAESVEISQNTPQDYDIPVYTSNSIAAALLEYFADATDEPNFIIEGSTRAFVADITGEGDMGVVAIRFAPPTGEVRYIQGIPQGDENSPVPQSRIFAPVQGEVIYFDIEFRSVEFGDMVISTRPSITESGRFVIDTARDRGDLALTLVDIDTTTSVPMFIPTLTIYRDFHGVQTGYTFYSFPGSFEHGMERGRTTITEQEFNNILAEIDFEEWAFAWALWEDETEQILSMASQ